jgi:hypothetical protein
MPTAIVEREATHQATIKREVQQHLAFVQSVADMLGETKQHAYWRLHLIVRVLGAPRVVLLLKETLQVEQQGGLMVKNGSRRRTPGGVFFHLAKTKYGHLLPASVMEPPKCVRRKQQSKVAA